MATDKQIAANRLNASKTQWPGLIPSKPRQPEAPMVSGPRTPEGKFISSLNSLRHDMLARSLLIRGESLDRFRALLATFYAHLQPRNPMENALVDSFVAARWRQMRFTSIDSAAINFEIDRQPPVQAACNGPTRAHLAISALAAQPGYTQSLHRYITRNERQLALAFEKLRCLRKDAGAKGAKTDPQHLAPPGYLELPEPDFSCGFLDPDAEGSGDLATHTNPISAPPKTGAGPEQPK